MSTNRVKHLIAIGLLAALVALAAVTLTSGAEPDPDVAKQRVAKQRVAIVSKGMANAAGAGEFVLAPLEDGALARDSGTTSATWSERVVMREGQRVAIDDGVETFEGKRGSLSTRFRIEWVEAGNGYHVATSTWRVVRGTGQYAEIGGRGRGGSMWLDRGAGPWSGRSEGILTLPVTSPGDTREGPADTEPTAAPEPAGTLILKLLEDDREAGVRFTLDGRVLTVRLLASAARETRRRVRDQRVRAWCGTGWNSHPGQRDVRRTRLWRAGRTRVRYRFRQDISHRARWCRLERQAGFPAHVAFVKFR